MSTRVLQQKPAGPLVQWLLPLSMGWVAGLGVAGCAHGQAIKDLPVAATEPSAMNNVNAPAEMIEAALADAANRSTTAKDDIKVLSAEAVTWSDGSLGCPQPGMMYTQALVPGYRIVLQAGEQTLNYHAMSRGRPVFCPSGRVTPPVPGQDNSAM
jgi:hypothetical protein